MKRELLLIGLSLALSACSPKLPVTAMAMPTIVNNMNQQAFAKQANYFSSAILQIPQSENIVPALEALKQLQAQTRQEAGNRAFVIHQDQNNPQSIVIWEAFQSEADFQKHLQSPHLQAFLNTKLVNFVQGYSSSRKSVTIPVFTQGYFSMAVLTLQAGQSLDQAQKAFATLEKKTRQESGNQAFVVLPVQTDGKAGFIIWEQFKNKAAFDVHLNSTHLKQFLALNLVSFEKGYTLQPISTNP